MKKIVYNDEIYYFHDNKFVDSSFIEVDTNIANELGKVMFKNLDYFSYNTSKLLELINSTKEAGQYKISKDVCMFSLDKFAEDENFVKTLLPILTSNLRKLKMSQQAVNIGKKYLPLFTTPALLTSLSAACCDVGNYEDALKYANAAYAFQGGGFGYQTELSLVYNRIRKESKLLD